MKRPLNCAAITEYLLAFWNQHDRPLAHMVKMLGYLVLVWLQQNFLSPQHEHHIQSLFALPSELEEFAQLCCQAWECLKDGNAPKPNRKDNQLCQLLPNAAVKTRDPHYFTSQPVQHLLAGIHVAVNLDHSEQQKLFEQCIDELSEWEKPVLDFVPHIAQLRNIQKEVPEEVAAFRALHSRCKREISTTVSQLPVLCHHSQEALRNSVVRISHNSSVVLESRHYSTIGELSKAGNVLELHFSEQIELSIGEAGVVNMERLATELSDYNIRLLDVSNRYITAGMKELKQFRGVALMKLSNTHLDAEACQILAQTLVDLHSLESLSLSQNPLIGGKGAIVRLILSLLDKKFLQTLDLRDTGLCNSQETDTTIDSTGDVCAIAWLLMCSSTLTSLDLALNDLDATCVKYLMHALLCNETTALKSLNINHSKFDQDATDMLIKTLKANRTITELDISDCGITDMPTNAVYLVLQTLPCEN